jgi:DNA-damage-inducible protein D
MKQIIVFDKKQIRRIWDENQEKWFFSVIDVISVLTESALPRRYWSDLKIKLLEEGSQLYEKIVQLKMIASDGKKYFTDCADAEILFRIIQSIPSPKAEPFKLWLAKVGHERLQETTDPEISLNRARNNWKMMGHSKEWIEQRMRGQEIRNKLTDYWANHKIDESDEFAILTNIIHREWTGLTVKEHKNLKNLKGHNLRDNMTDAELLFTSLAELTTHKIAENEKAVGFVKNAVSAKKGGCYTKTAKEKFEKLTKSKVVSKQNYLGQKNIKEIKK